MPRTKYPHAVVARIWEPIQPIDRGEIYEDNLAEVLDELEAGEVIGGGTQLSKDGEIEFADIELRLADLADALGHVKGFLESVGAPVGSELLVERGGKSERVPFGSKEGIAIYLDGVGLPKHVYRDCDINELADQITAALTAEEAGEIRGSWVGPTETAIYLYGPDAEAAFARIEPVLRAYPLCQNARVVLRHGNPNLKPRTVQLPRHG